MGKIKTLALKTIRQCIVEFLLYEYHAQKSTTIDLNMTKNYGKGYKFHCYFG